MLANAIELRDQYTRGHVERVRDHAHVLANVLGLSAGQMEQIHYGSILHDIGKIHIPESVLKKPGPLTDAEWVEMKKHPLIGVDMVKDIPYLAAAIPVIRFHHERWDGKGYPDKLSGEAIPLVARIVTLADSLDAMSTSRPYQRGLSADQAYEEVLRGSGTMYDPQIVSAFQRGWGEIREHLR
jgi:HD-GYP domain-containing protein (c-di-GMP phosphodiesterase class II)